MISYASLCFFASCRVDHMFQASNFLLIKAGFLNTIVLLTSSLTMAFAVHYAALRDHARTLRYLALTFVLGTAFLGVKAYEWRVDYEEHVVPGKYFGWDWAAAVSQHHNSRVAHRARSRPHRRGKNPNL